MTLVDVRMGSSIVHRRHYATDTIPRMFLQEDILIIIALCERRGLGSAPTNVQLDPRVGAVIPFIP
jgi:hypothetical protein